MPTTMSPGYPSTTEKQDLDLKSYLMMVVEDLKKGINNSLKEIQENSAKDVETLKEEAQNSLKELQENTVKQVETLKRKHKNPSRNYRRTLLEVFKVEVLKELQANTTKQVEETQKSKNYRKTQPNRRWN
jgi:vacuolar-type H+-ATPase subunit E/Vma4